MFTIIDINKIKQETCENENENCKVENPNKDETKHKQKSEVGEILAQESNEMRYVNISDNIDNNKAQEENFIKEEIVPKILDDEIKHEFVDEIVKEETEDTIHVIDVKPDIYDAFPDGTDNNEEKSPRNQMQETVAHKRVYTWERPFKCDVCNKTFTMRKYLVYHKRSHTGEKPYKCDKCDRTFTYRNTAWNHKRSHTGEKPYKCDVCDKTFTKKQSLVTHQHVHTGGKPFKCDKCEKTFRNKYSLVKHKRSHTGEEPYKCDICEKTFTVKHSLVTHQHVHTGEKPFKCDKCEKSYTVRHYLVKHKCEKPRQETCGNELNSDSITTVNYCKVGTPNEDETKQKLEVVGEIIAKESNEMRCINISTTNNKAQEGNFIKEEVVSRSSDDEIKYEFVDDIVKEETEDN